MGYRHYCLTASLSPDHVSISCGGPDGKPGRGPRSGKCAGCGGTLRVEQGKYGVYLHSSARGHKGYAPEHARRLYLSPAAAERYALQLGVDWVVRWTRQDDSCA